MLIRNILQVDVIYFRISSSVTLGFAGISETNRGTQQFNCKQDPKRPTRAKITINKRRKVDHHTERWREKKRRGQRAHRQSQITSLHGPERRKARKETRKITHNHGQRPETGSHLSIGWRSFRPPFFCVVLSSPRPAVGCCCCFLPSSPSLGWWYPFWLVLLFSRLPFG